MEDCVFDKIVRGEIPAAKVWEDENFLAFLTIAPINPGHTLVIPKRHIPYLFDLEDVELAKLMAISKKISFALKSVFNPKSGRIGIMVAGMQVPHAHIHLIPLNNEGDLNFALAKKDTPAEELQVNAERISQALVE